MLVLLFPVLSVALAALSQEGSRAKRTSYGSDVAGRRGGALWGPQRYLAGWSLEEEAAEGHMFTSVAPPG